MAVPSKKDLHRPALEIVAASGGSVSVRQFNDVLARHFELTEEDLDDRSSSGSRRFYDRVSFALQDLKLSGLIMQPARGYRQITDAGQRFLQNHQGVITDRDLRQMRTQLPTDGGGSDSAYTDYLPDSQDATPTDLIDLGYKQLQTRLADDITESLAKVTPDRFEQLVVDLLVKMGYGQGETIGRSGDGGIDGIINQDALGLEKVYIQAKRYTAGSVGEPEIRNFSGSLDPYGATKGVFITTSTFSNSARQTAQTISAGNKLIRLVDGKELAQLMIKHGVGVVTEYTYEIKKLDENYFAEEI